MNEINLELTIKQKNLTDSRAALWRARFNNEEKNSQLFGFSNAKKR